MVIAKATCAEHGMFIARGAVTVPHLCQGGAIRCHVEIDLHVDNNVVVLDEADLVLPQKRLRNDLTLIIMAIKTCQAAVQRISMESAHDWYWLVDGMIEAGCCVHLIRAPILSQYSELKHADDQHDVRWFTLLILGLSTSWVPFIRKRNGPSVLIVNHEGRGTIRQPDIPCMHRVDMIEDWRLSEVHDARG